MKLTNEDCAKGRSIMSINESQENYLERILFLKKKKGYARSIDIANALGVTKPSVSHAMKQLRNGGYITMDDGNFIHLTDEGKAIAQVMMDRHLTLANIFIQLGVDEDTAYEDACKIEHDISEQTFEALRQFACDHLPSTCKEEE